MDADPPVLRFSERLDPVEGWRAWRLVRRPDGGLGLGSLFSPEERLQERWPARAARRAVCAAEGSYHAAPALECRCGYYAYAERARLAGASRRSAVVGSVSMWGSIVGHEFGYRAEFAYPQRLRLVCGRCLRIGRDRPARWVLDRGDELIAACPRHARWLVRGRRVDASVASAQLLDTYAVEMLPPIGIAPPPLGRRVARGVRSFLGAKTSIGWLLVAVLVATIAFWAASRPTGVDHVAADAPRVAAATGPAAPDVHHRFDDPSAGVVLRESCGVGPPRAITVVPCSKPHEWTSSAIFHPGIVPRCFGAIAEVRPHGRTLCWVPEGGGSP